MIVSQLYVYPFKSGRGVELHQAQVETKGFLWDREFMLVSGSGKCITQRQFPQLAKVKVKIDRQFQEQNIKVTLMLEDNTFDAFNFDSSLSDPLIEVEIWGDRILAVDQGDEVANWFHRYLKLSSDKVCRLVRQSPEYVRSLPQEGSIYEARPLGLADSSPVMLTATASLGELNQRIMEIHSQAITVEMRRFRSNIVLETIEPFIEDNWSSIQIGNVRFKITKPCTRCIIANIDQQQGIKDPLKEPLNTLGTFRQLSEKGVMFGVNMIPQNEGMIEIGDRLEVLQTRS